MPSLIFIPETIPDRQWRKGIIMKEIRRAVRGDGPVMEQRSSGDLEYLTFPLLEETGIVKHLFTTRHGGASKGIFSTMNLSFQRGDDPECVLENYRRIGKVMGIAPSRMVSSCQTHTTNIRLVTEEDCGAGVTRPQDSKDIDGLITQERGIALVTLFADCVPLYFVDPVHRAIGLAHSGWRGSAAQMGACMIEAMEKTFASKPGQLYAAIGPSICQGCYEVSEEVAEAFEEILAGTDELCGEYYRSGYRNLSTQQGKPLQVVTDGRTAGKYQLDLWLANAVILRKAGIPQAQIAVTDICTCENGTYLFSHRASQGKRGNLAAFLALAP